MAVAKKCQRLFLKLQVERENEIHLEPFTYTEFDNIGTAFVHVSYIFGS